MGLLEYKSISGGIVDIDTTGRRIVTNWSGLDEIDYDEDEIISTAYNKTISERGPKGADLIYHITDHYASVKNIVGKVEDLYVKGRNLQAVTLVSSTSHGNDVFQLYQDGIIKQHSVGIVPTRIENLKTHRRIMELVLFEGSSVLWGANQNTGTISVGKSLVTLEECNDELEVLLKAWKKGTYTDETFGLLELRIKQIQKSYSELLSAAPEQSTQHHAPEQSTHDKEDNSEQLIKSLLDIKTLING